MAVKAFEPGNTSGQPGGSTILDRVLARLKVALDSLRSAVTNDVLVTATIATTDTKVFHGLGATVKTWEVVDRNANATIWQSSTANPTPALYIVLKASAPVTVKLRFM